MAQIIEENLLQVIEKDDIKAFNAIMENAQCGSYRLGRFPVLSVLYLYKSRKILGAYEEKFIKITTWEELREPASVAKAFSDVAGKCLRLYLNEVVSPLEMLLILDKTSKLKRVYPLTRPSGAVKERLQSIYSVKYSLGIKYEGNDIVIDRRPLNRSEKKKIAVICLSSFLAVAIAVAAPVTALTLNPPLADGEVTKFKHIDFSAKKTYTLKQDVTVPDNFSVDKMNCSIVGEGKKLIFGKGASLGEFSGKMSGLEIVSSGSPIFSTITEKAEISNVTINVNADVATSESSAFIARTSYGLLDGVTVNISGKVYARTPEGYDEESGDVEELTFGGLVLNNAFKYSTFGTAIYGIIRNSTVNYSNFTLEGETYANGIFAGIVGENRGAVGNVTVTGSISSHTFDLAGACSTNMALLSNIVNEAALSQTSGDGWNPIVCGIAVENGDVIENCENKGALTAKSTSAQEDDRRAVSVAGIVYANSGNVKSCKNSGNISAEGKCVAYVGGIAARSVDLINYCLSSGNISVNASSAYVGGILGSSEVVVQPYFNGYSIYLCNSEYCISSCNFNVTVPDGKVAYVGGIVGGISEKSIDVTKYDENEQPVTEEVYYGGGALNCYFIGKCQTEVNYFGSIVGVCGANIYETNLYYFDAEYHNFSDNYYLDGSKPFGATVTIGEDNEEVFELVEGKGATVATQEEMEKTEAYKKILEMLEG